MFDPAETVDLKLAYAEWLHSPPAHQLAEMTAAAYAKQGLGNTPEEKIDSLRKAQNFWVAPDMIRIVEAAQATLPDEDVLLEEPPAPHGFLILSEPLPLLCGDPECTDEHPVGGLHWRPGHRILPATQWAEEQHDDGIMLHWFGPAANDEERRFFGSSMAPIGSGMFLPAGRPLNTSESVRLGAMSAESAEMCRYARTMWTLMQQPLAEIGDLTPARAQRKRAQRIDQAAGPIVIVTLRRTAHKSNGEANVEWSHRWMVRGHWRRQWHPRLQAHRPIWINEHVKGPDDKPLVVQDKVIAWRR